MTRIYRYQFIINLTDINADIIYYANGEKKAAAAYNIDISAPFTIKSGKRVKRW